MKKELLSSARPAKALYHAAKDVSRPKTPAALMMLAVGSPLSVWTKWPMARRRKVMSRRKKREKKATVERKVRKHMIVVKMNHPCQVMLAI